MQHKEMSIIQFEIKKIIERKSLLIFLVVTVLLFPVLMAVGTHVSVHSNQISEGLFMEKVPYYIIRFSQSYFFIPVYILIFASQEFSGGHVSRVVFLKSRKFYFASKIAYCCLISFLFSFLGLAALLLSKQFSGFTGLLVSPAFYVEYVVSVFISSFAFSILLLVLVFVLRTPWICFIFFIGWQTVEEIVFRIFYRLYNLKLVWLPFKSIQLLFNKTIEDTDGSYRRLFIEFDYILIIPFAYIILLILALYKYFLVSDLKSLSD